MQNFKPFLTLKSCIVVQPIQNHRLYRKHGKNRVFVGLNRYLGGSVE